MMFKLQTKLIAFSIIYFATSLCHADPSTVASNNLNSSGVSKDDTEARVNVSVTSVGVSDNYSDSRTYTLPTFTVYAQKTANVRSSNTFETPVSNLDFDPRIDFQARNMAEAQGDVNIQGGIFEATGFQVGSATLFDPQTGHYYSELPIAPEMLKKPEVYTGIDNALHGFNSTAGTLSYKWSQMTTGGSATFGVGDNQLNFQRIHNAKVEPLRPGSRWTLGYEAEYSRSESDGTIRFSDHDFERATARIQLRDDASQTDIFAGYQSKFFGLFGMYTGDQYTQYNPYETEEIQTRLFMFNHQKDYDIDSHWEASAYLRQNKGHYIFNRLSPDSRFMHEVDSISLGLSGLHAIDEVFALNYHLHLTGDHIESTSLEEGKFTSRTYQKISLLPQYSYKLNNQKNLIFKAGLSLNNTNRDASKLSPMAGISLVRKHNDGKLQHTYLSYADTTQVIGYGAIGGSEDSGLFRSNHNLLRETTKNIELGHAIEHEQWKLNAALFHRWDKDLVDWTYAGAGARSAKNMDIKTFGLELIGSRQWNKLQGIASYSYLKKNEDYGSPDVVGSFYALNFPKHRATLGFIYSPNDLFEIRVDNEWRDHRRNSLRTGPNHALLSRFGISYFPNQTKDYELFIALDKPWNDSFQEIPGTPGRSEQFSLGITSKW